MLAKSKASILRRLLLVLLTSSEDASAVKTIPQRVEHSVYTDSFLDGVLHRFLTFADPASLSVFPSVEESLPLSDAIPVSEWVRLFENDILTVSSHPTLNGLYSITTIFPTLSLRSLWELMLSIESRTEWDNSCEQTQHLEDIGPVCSNDGQVQDRQATISYLALKSMFPIKPRDMVLLSVLARLAPSPTGCQRLVSATTSVQHASKPAQKGYQRMEIANSGFLAEELPEGGCKLMQISDLSGLGTWSRSSLLRLQVRLIYEYSTAEDSQHHHSESPTKVTDRIGSRGGIDAVPCHTIEAVRRQLVPSYIV